MDRGDPRDVSRDVSSRRDPARRFGPSAARRSPGRAGGPPVDDPRDPPRADESVTEPDRRPPSARGRNGSGSTGSNGSGLRRRDLAELSAAPSGARRGDGAAPPSDRPRRPAPADRDRDRDPRDRDPRDRDPRDRDPRDRPLRDPGRPRTPDRDRDGNRDRDRERGRPAPPPPRPPGTTRPPRDAEPPDDRGGRRSLARTVRLGLVVISVLVFALSGTAWAALSGSISGSSALGNGPVGNAADGATDILLVGVDSRTDAQGQPLPNDVLRELGAGAADGVINTDTMMLVRVPNDGSRAVAFSIPRDSYVNIPGAFRRDKINSAYPGAKAEEANRLVQSGVTDPREVDVRSSEAGRQELVRAVGDLTGLTVDHFAEVNLLGFYTLTNAIGGVDVCLKNPVDDDLSGARFPAGPRTVAGHDALAFVRQRHGLPNGDLDRVRRQQAFLASMSRKVLSSGTLGDPITLSRLLDAVRQSVVLDGNWDLLQFARQMQDVSAGAVAFLTIPTNGTRNIDGRGEVLDVDPSEVRTFVNDAIGPEDSADANDEGPAPATIPVDVRNASDTQGAAARVVAVLSAQGYARTVAGNAEAPAPRSEVLFGPAGDGGGARVARSLGDLPTRFDPTVPPNSVRVLLGADYRGPGAAAPAPAPSSGFSTDSDEAPAVAPPPQPAITADGVPCID
ncbi:LytR family transcriptional attenuator [Actinomycetospora succinea]|uniref:LytR family transcriptional attenuator n=1 Tax=Actinomycetospora succinea TaxID=663603 RepID=A0A4R6VR07_9PSEU|nr:LCP family protein [Actinomycetospora succinea]TDQ64977.1 LytR family transcriptional attenuator [Actinomycetospora succinea]